MDRLLTAREIAEYLDLNEVTVRRKAARGEIPAIRIGKHFRFNKQHIDDWLNKISKSISINILVIDDEPIILKLFKDCLDGVNCRFVATTSGQEALQFVRDDNFDLIFLDLVMPDVQGNKVFKSIREIDGDVPIAIITGYPDSDLLKEVMTYGPFLVMNKPFTREDILKTIQMFTRKIAGNV